MNSTTAYRALAILVVVVLGMATQGCATVQKGFVGETNEDITPFAQQTIEVMTMGELVLRDDEFVYLRQFVDDDFAELDRLQELLARIERFRAAILRYSVELVRVAEQYETDEAKVAGYAAAVDEQLREPAISGLTFSDVEWNAVIADVRRQPDLLAAFRAFQPVIDRANELLQDLTAEIENDALPAVRAEFDRRIQTSYADVLAYLQSEVMVRDDTLAGISAVIRAAYGDDDAIPAFRRKGSYVAQRFFTKDRYSDDELEKIDAELKKWLEDSTSHLALLETDQSAYERSRSELDAAEQAVFDDLGLARLQMLTWARAHQALANGVREPGKWLEPTLKIVQAARKII